MMPAAVRLFRTCLVLALWWVVPAVRAQEAYTLVPLHTFGPADGKYPVNLAEGRDGNLYGVTLLSGGAQSRGTGTVFRLTPDGAFLTLDTFGPPAAGGGNTDGEAPDGLVQATDGNLYGITQTGGGHGGGTAFRLTAAGIPGVLYDFSAPDAAGTNATGNRPLTLSPGRDGNLYGTTFSGGANGGGIVFQLTTGGVLTPLASLPTAAPLPVPGGGQTEDGSSHFSRVTQGRDGNVYGVTGYGGAHLQGTLFCITPAGVMTVLHDFTAPGTDGTNADGAEPGGGLTEGADGRFYGTTDEGGAHAGGTVYAVTPDGVLTTLYDFDATGSSGDNASGCQPFGDLILGKDGNFYGVAAFGGPAGRGTIFSITPGGKFTVLYRVTTADAISGPFGLFQSREGEFYVIDQAIQGDGTGAVYALKPVAAVRPVASLAVIRLKATVDIGGPAVIQVNLSAASARNIVVHYTVGGSATNGVDDTALSGAVKIKAGRTSAVIYVTPHGELGGAARRTVRLTLLTKERYTVGTSATAKVKLLPTFPP